jgi:CheY-like chemotaxis protein
MSFPHPHEPSDADEHGHPADALSAWTSARLTSLMTRHGVASRHQATLIAQICAISVSQARRKLRGAVWLFNEVIAVCRHFGESLDAVFTPEALRGHPSENSLAHAAALTTYPAVLLLDERRVDCDIQLGAILTASHAAESLSLVATHLPSEGWLVASPSCMLRQAHTGPQYAVQHLQIRTRQEHARARIAVLDDDAGSAGALTDWFNELGYRAQAFTHAAQLLATSLTAHDAYVIDLILAGGQTSQAVVEQIRLAQPDAPIVLLTGQLRDGTASEATLSTILRTQGVTFFEKPVRPAVLTAAIQSGLDRLATAHG